MQLQSRLFAGLLALAPLLDLCLAQASVPVVYTDPTTGITFDTWPVPDAPANGDSEGGATSGGLNFGVALPSNALTVDSTDFIGYLQCASKNDTATGWCGISFGGAMTNSLLLVAWPYKGEILTSFRYATAYTMPVLYTGNATLSQISSTVNSTHYTLVFKCQNCLAWNQDNTAGSAPTSQGLLVLGWAQAFPQPRNPSCPDAIDLDQHDNGMNIFGASLTADAASTNYDKWAALATKNPDVIDCSGVTNTTITSQPVPANVTYDYIVVGAGAAGIPMADRLSQAGKKVLLIEKGPASSGMWGGTMKPAWLEGTNLTRFDVPGLCNEIWVNAAGVSCTDTDQMEGCVLGGGTEVNAGLWWKPHTVDWDYNFPKGWQSADMADATARVFSRIPGTDHPSMDGKLYLQQGFDTLTAGLAQTGWTSVSPVNNNPNAKNHTYGHTEYMFSGGERGGPVTTYLKTAHARSNFQLWLNTTVKRVVRTGSKATGIEVEAYLNNGYNGTVNLAPNGRIILSAGTFASAKLLMRSGIGPTDQLNIVKSSSDGPTMISSDQWINLPVGYNLVDHVNTDTVITHPSVVFFDFYAAWNMPNDTGVTYLANRTGILAQAAPNIGPMMWDEIKGADNITRQIQWTSRVEGSDGTPSGNAMTISQYLGRGSTSRGRMAITSSLNTIVQTVPYLHDPNDVAAVIQGIKNLQAGLSTVKNLTWTYPNASTTVEDFVNTMIVAYANRRANHWLGTAKLGTDDGRVNNGSAVVDLNCKVYGMDNLFVVDGSIFPGMVSTNPSSYIVIAAEHASQRILALPASGSGSTTSKSSTSRTSTSTKSSSTTTSKAVTTSTKPTTSSSMRTSTTSTRRGGTPS